MAKPRVFISSTFYDLKYIRSSLDQFVEGLGYEPVLSEKGAVAFDPSLPLDESCYREVKNSDILVLIVGGRYGSAASAEGQEEPKDFFDRYASITRREYESAVERNIPVYILVERAVYTEYETFKKNRSAKSITYAHVDSVNVFLLLDQILSQSRNNALHQFEHQGEITSWLRHQWSGLFKQMLAARSEQRQLSSLADQVEGLAEISTTFKRYLEEIVPRVSKGEATGLIAEEEKRLAESKRAIEELIRKADALRGAFEKAREVEKEETDEMAPEGIAARQNLADQLAATQKLAEEAEQKFADRIVAEEVAVDTARTEAAAPAEADDKIKKFLRLASLDGLIGLYTFCAAAERGVTGFALSIVFRLVARARHFAHGYGFVVACRAAGLMSFTASKGMWHSHRPIEPLTIEMAKEALELAAAQHERRTGQHLGDVVKIIDDYLESLP